jgi:hypothetical protein
LSGAAAIEGKAFRATQAHLFINEVLRLGSAKVAGESTSTLASLWMTEFLNGRFP